ncbi:hypothetical protein JY651_01760 [Pyxidicoccus parkwayensis]|uniref:Head-to-tail adaptor n=1 Tax=Pyxidicoccus parkwayensis TaxID=2813578 RepID=A0ABX7P2H8_9BACT|nr:hypothetical protein [Pyxidicoccus parkwaysis]QSQ23738.1 hypothetical protein JY651_01760 [Pyxidicoccus parkwaysis]
MPTKYNSDFEIDAVLETLRAINSGYADESPEGEALRAAAVALIYVREAQKLEDYRAFFRKFYTPAVESVVVGHTFATRDEAEAWLVTGEPRDGALVRIAGQGFQVITRRNGQGFRFLRTPLPEELMERNPGDVGSEG